MSCAHWLNFKCGMGMNAARERVRVARALPDLPKIATHGTAYHVETLVRKYHRVQRQREVDTANCIHVTREMTYYWDDDGALVFHGRLPPEQGALLLKALEMQLEKGFTEAPDRDVSAETSRRIGCDCTVIHVHESDDGEPLSIGRRSRLVPPAIRRALRLRDDGCRFPGCIRKQLVDAHHIEHWSEGGETSLDNLVQLCRQHHRLVHEGGFSCESSRSGEIVFRDRRDRPLPHWSVLPRRNTAVEYLHERFDRLGIDCETCLPHWHAGDTSDWQMAVEGLLACETRNPGGLPDAPSAFR